MNYCCEFVIVATFIKSTSDRTVASFMHFYQGDLEQHRPTESRSNVWTFANLPPSKKRKCTIEAGAVTAANVCQKPIRLLRHIIEHFSEPDDVVLDLCSGMMSTAVACILSNRHCVCVENNTFQYMEGIARVQTALDKIIDETDKDSLFTNMTDLEF